MEGCPYVEERPSVQYRRTLGIESVSDQPNGRRHNTTSWFTAVGIGLPIGGAPMQAQEWKGTIGEPLRDSTKKALALAIQIRDAGAQIFGSWRCPACFQQMSMFGKQAGTQINYVECDKPKERPRELARCEEAKISAVLTWTLPYGECRVDIQKREELSRWAELNDQ